MCQNLFLKKFAGNACKFTEKETLAQVFSCEFFEISKNTFFTEHVWAAASDLRSMRKRFGKWQPRDEHIGQINLSNEQRRRLAAMEETETRYMDEENFSMIVLLSMENQGR